LLESKISDDITSAGTEIGNTISTTKSTLETKISDDIAASKSELQALIDGVEQSSQASIDLINGLITTV
jgi:hypothetical protein